MAKELGRRAVLGAGLLGASLAGRAGAQPGGAAPEGVEPGRISSEVLEIWPEGRIPGSAGVRATRQVVERGAPGRHDRAVLHVARPSLEVFRPARPNGGTVLILPGGGYVRLAVDKEGAMGARRMAAAGLTAFVLEYRLPGDGWAAGYDAPLQDVQRAVRLLRSGSDRWGVDPRRIGVMGFSAGGHLAAALLTRSEEATYAPVDARDHASARPDFAVLGYAPMSWRIAPGSPGAPARETPRDEAALGPLYARVQPGLSPTFLVHAADDPTVPVEDSLRMFSALKAASVAAELHVYQQGGHGFGFALSAEQPAAAWPNALLRWAKADGWLG